MIYNAQSIVKHPRIRQQILTADVCVVGTGAGGSAAAYQLSRAGKKVVMVERGEFLTPADFTQLEHEMYPRLFYQSGSRRTVDKAVRIIHGKGVGGSTLHNINLCKRVPAEIVQHWAVQGLTLDKLNPYYDQTERLLNIQKFNANDLNTNNELLRLGTQRLGFKGGYLSHNRKGCRRSGFCELGCSYDAKMNAMRVLVPEVIKNGGEILAECSAEQFEWSGRKVSGLQVRCGEQSFKIQADYFVSSGGAIESPALLQRSGVPDPHELVGSRLHIHPGSAVAGVFARDVYSWVGIPQTYECTEFLSFNEEDDKRVWLITGSAHPVAAAALLPGFGNAHRQKMSQWANMATVAPMIHDQSVGSIRAKGRDDVKISYELNSGDRKQMEMGLRRAADILFAAGAQKIILPFGNDRALSRAELSDASFAIEKYRLDIMSVHPMSSLWMGESSRHSCTDVAGRYHQMDNLYVADTSLFPSSLGVPPQVSAYTFGFYVGDQLLKAA